MWKEKKAKRPLRDDIGLNVSAMFGVSTLKSEGCPLDYYYGMFVVYKTTGKKK